MIKERRGKKKMMLTKTKVTLMNILWDKKQVVTLKKQGKSYVYIPLLSHQKFYERDMC